MAFYIANSYFEIHNDIFANGATQEAVNNDDLKGVHIIVYVSKKSRKLYKYKS